MVAQGRGRKPKPTVLKELAGNPGRRPLNEQEPRPATADPKMPRGKLNAEGKKLWREVAPKLAELGLLTEVDMAALEMACNHYGLAREAMALIERMGLFVKDRDGQPRKNPALQLYRDNSQAFKQYLVEFGMTPSSRSRIQAEPIDQEPSLAEILYSGLEDLDDD